MKNIQPDFRRTLIVVACIHGVFILGIIYFMRQPVKRPQEQVTWLDTQSFGSGASSSPLPTTPIQAPPPVIEEEKSSETEIEEKVQEEKKEEPIPIHPSAPTPSPVDSSEASQVIPEEESPPPLPENNSEIPLLAPKPKLTPPPKPTPKAILKPKSQPIEKPSPKPTSRPSLQSKSKAEPPVSPKASPKVAPKPNPEVSAQEKALVKHSSTQKESSLHDSKASFSHEKSETKKSEIKSKGAQSSTHGNPSAKAAFLKSKNGTDNSSSSSHGEGSGTGIDSGALGAYHELIHDRFYSQWEQPTTIPTEHKHDFVCTLQLTIASDGTISHFALSKPSGNPVMDASVLGAAGKVSKIAPLPHGVGTGGSYVVNINFELE